MYFAIILHFTGAKSTKKIANVKKVKSVQKYHF